MREWWIYNSVVITLFTFFWNSMLRLIEPSFFNKSFKGNIILTDKDYVILQLMRSHAFSETAKFSLLKTKDFIFLEERRSEKNIRSNTQQNFLLINLIFQLRTWLPLYKNHKKTLKTQKRNLEKTRRNRRKRGKLWRNQYNKRILKSTRTFFLTSCLVSILR